MDPQILHPRASRPPSAVPRRSSRPPRRGRHVCRRHHRADPRRRPGRPSAAPSASPSATAGVRGHVTVLRFAVKFSDHYLVDVPPGNPGGVGLGDYALFSDQLLDRKGHVVGTEGGSGLVTDIAEGRSSSPSPSSSRTGRSRHPGSPARHRRRNSPSLAAPAAMSGSEGASTWWRTATAQAPWCSPSTPELQGSRRRRPAGPAATARAEESTPHQAPLTSAGRSLRHDGGAVPAGRPDAVPAARPLPSRSTPRR